MSERGVAHLFLVFFLLLAIAIGIFLNSHSQVFRSKASENQNWAQNLKITDQNNNQVYCDLSQDPVICYAPTDQINVAWDDSN